MVRMMLSVVWDSLIGDPPNWPHPVRLIGWTVRRYEKIIRSAFTNLYVGGFVLLIATLATFVLPLIWLKQAVHPLFFIGFETIGIGVLLAAKCLATEGKRMYEVLGEKDLVVSRKALSYLVGRDTENLSESDIAKATIETLSENTIDGVVAPLFYALLGFYFDMPLLFMMIYKIVNTLDSMVGYIQHPYTEIGFASAKLDDLLNFVPARLGAMVMLLAGTLLGFDSKRGLRVFMRDRLNHKSPNSGHPEATVAGLLGIMLGGTNTYFGIQLEKPSIGEALVSVEITHILSTVRLMWLTEILVVILGGCLLWLGGIK